MASNNATQALRGRAVLVTRPAHQAQNLARLINEAGGEAVRFPALAIETPTDPARAKEVLASLRRFDLAVFVSPNAVDHGLALLGSSWPEAVPIAAVGEGSAAALRRKGILAAIVPAHGADSESLLAMPELSNLSSKRVLILRGEGGRELLAQELRRRGAEVTYAECYRRAQPRADPAELIGRWERGGVDAVTVTSGETLDNLFAMLGSDGQKLLCVTPVFAPHVNIAERAKRFGLTEVATTPPGDEGLLIGLSAWFCTR
jgi:uroporphyrinogen-III synthase